MNALDRYLRTVKQFLPRAQRDEILRELADRLRAQIQDREAELGRSLNDADLDAILARHGSPTEVAGRYRTHGPRLAVGVELIGPALFPHYLKWLALPIGITVLIFAAVLLAGKHPTPAQFLFPVAVQFASVTLLFIVAQACEKEFGLFARRKKPALPAPELIRRYLHAVRFWLPKPQKDDILTELADDLHSKIEDREAELGRELDEGDLVAILKQRGEPISVASSYLPPQYLIGPALFPVYRFVVKMVVLWILVPIYVLVVGPIVVKTAADPALAAIPALWSLLMAAVFAVGVITVVFAAIERCPPRSSSEWDPRRLPPAPSDRPAGDLEPMPRYRAVANICVSGLFALGWVYLAEPQTAADFEGVRIALAPFWRSLFWPILAVLLSGAAVGLAGLLRPNSARLHAAMRLAANGLALAVIGVLLTARTWVDAAPKLPRAAVEDAAKWTNLGLWISLLVVGLVVAAEAVRDARRLFRRRVPLHSLALIALAFLLFTPAQAQPSLASDAEIRAILADRVDVQHASLGTVVGIITSQGRRIVSYGRASQGESPALDGDTVFEVGSVTKVFTALLLADMAGRGEVSLADPVARYLPPGTQIPSRDGRTIALVDLATHTSGLPFAPSDLNVLDAAAWAQYTEDKLYRFLSTYELREDIGTRWAYSNLGMGLLGQALARRAGMGYEALVRARIAAPLGMKSTAITLSPQMKARLATGHDTKLQPAPAWEAPAMLGAGALRSTANDLLTFLAAFLGERKSHLAPAMAAMLATRRPAPTLEQALGWWVLKLGGTEEPFIASGGQTAGFACTLAYDPKMRAGVVVLSNVAKDDGGLGWHLLRPAFPVVTSPAKKRREEKKEIVIDPKLFDRYTGRYKPPERGDTIVIERSGDALLVRFPSAPAPFRLHAETERSFFITETDLQVTFQIDGQGRATAIVVRFAGTDTLAPRTEP